MGRTAEGTSDPADSKSQRGTTTLDVSAVVTMDVETAGMTAGTGKLVEL